MQRQRTTSVWLITHTYLALAGVIAAGCVLFGGTPLAQATGDVPRQQLYCLLATGAFGFLYWLYRRRLTFPPLLGARLEWLVVLPTLYAILQAIPIPIAAVRLLSPERGRAADALAPVIATSGWIPISLTPSSTVLHALGFAAATVLFFCVYSIATDRSVHPWTAALPLIVIATAEAALGMAQVSRSTGAGLIAEGTFAIRNHFAGLLEMVLPFAAVWPLTMLRRFEAEPHLPVRRAVLACAGWGAAAVIFSGIIYSLSRTGFLTASACLGLAAWLGVVRPRAWRRNAAATAAAAAGFVLLVLILSPESLINRFAQMNSESEGRTSVWRESIGLVRAYPVTGCGLGAFGSAFYPYKRSVPSLYQDYAHNDYVQYLAELGVAGFAIFCLPIAVILARLRQAQGAASHLRWLAIACLASAFSLGIHSLVDFNLYVPANRMVFAWILALAAATGTRARQLQDSDG